jgi:hypothetical protein
LILLSDLAAHSRLASGGSPRLSQISRIELHQARHLSHQVSFVIAQATVGEDDSPHYLRERQFLTQIVLRSDASCELEVIEALYSLSFGQAEKLGAFLPSETEMVTDGRFDVVSLFNAEHAVCMRELE